MTSPETTIDPLPMPKARRSLWQRFRYKLKDNLPWLALIGIVITFTVAILWYRIVVIVEAGEGGVLYRPVGWGMVTEGVVTDHVYPEGLHLIFPINTMTRYNARVQIIMHEFEVLTNKGLPVKLKLAVRYRPIFGLLGVLHQKVGPDYPNKIILPQIESVLRKGLGVHSPEQIYTNEDLLLNKLIARAIEEVGRKYVIVDDVIIRSVTLPAAVRGAIEEKLVDEQRHLAYEYKIKREIEEAKRKRIESKGIRDYAANIESTMGNKVLRWKGIQATLELAKSPNSKLILIGGGKDGLPLILNAGNWGSESTAVINDRNKKTATSRQAASKTAVANAAEDKK
ncbi:MAG: prohibitin family protein [Mariprofundaceae bacterium]|nr:prohibitin family protein [Mariprofundaceae bacterium]